MSPATELFFYHVSLSPSPSYSGTRARVSPQKVDIFVRKKGQKNADSLHEARGLLLVRVRKRSNTHRTNVDRSKERTRGTGTRGLLARGEERESRVKQRWLRRESENRASAYEERKRERVKSGGEDTLSLSRKVEFRRWQHAGGAQKSEWRTLITRARALRTSGEQKAPRIL